MAQETTHYIHGTHEEEQLRLSRMNDILNEGSMRELSLRGDERILDLGSGLGQFARAMARAVPRGSVTAIERSGEQLAEARRQATEAGEAGLADLRQGDALALELAPEEWGSFDLVHTRFLLEHLPDPGAAVLAMVRAAKPGGRVILEDDDHDMIRLYPEPPGFWPLWSAYMRSYDRNGTDPYIGRRLVSLLHAAGAEPRRNTWIFFGACAGSEHFGPLVGNLIGVLMSAREMVIGFGLIEEAAFDIAIEAIAVWSKRPDAALWYPMAWAEGIKPGGG